MRFSPRSGSVSLPKSLLPKSNTWFIVLRRRWKKSATSISKEMLMYPLLLVRYGELSLKGRNRRVLKTCSSIISVLISQISPWRDHQNLWTHLSGNRRQLGRAGCQASTGVRYCLHFSRFAQRADLEAIQEEQHWLPRTHPAKPLRWRRGGLIRTSLELARAGQNPWGPSAAQFLSS